MDAKTPLPSQNIPVLAMRNTVVFPGQTIPIVVGRSKSVAALQEAKKLGWLLTLAQKTELKEKEPGPEDLYRVGTLAKIERISGDEDKGFQLVISGQARFELTSLEETTSKDEGSYLIGAGQEVADLLDLEENTAKSLIDNMKSLAKDILSLMPGNLEKVVSLIEGIDDPVLLTHMAAQYLDIRLAKKQELLEIASLKNRYLLLLELMIKQREELKLQHEVGQKITSKMGRQQREAILREQIRVLQDELGEGSSGSDYYEKIDHAEMPDEVRKVAIEQAQRLDSIGPQSPESHIIRNYLDLLVALPWQESKGAEIELDKARVTLDQDHYGLDEIKKRIIQHLAVMKLKKGKKGSILLFIGPPGVGKTSLGRSIAAALERPFVRASLGGVRDDAEIRGHRRTYVGALPGRIIDGIKRAKANNPVFVLDEIDKLTRGFSGDPASALLEVLDPEQNNRFLDHYLDVPFDLSNVFFIATANSTEGIPGPLLDRMEVIRLSGYTTLEKLHIGQNHLIPKQIEEHGLRKEQVDLSEETQLKVINSYTREAGVRELQRVIASLMRHAAEQVLTHPDKIPVKITPECLDEVLGAEKYSYDLAGDLGLTCGVATGLAWTPMGGDILFVEARSMPGKGKLNLTGQLGDVMKESAQIALSLLRSRLPRAEMSYAFDEHDLHLHVPAGAIPKDGPSAGVTMLTAMASVLTGKKVDPHLAMTGEITLRGAVLPVGGIKEKVIAAHRAGIKRVVLAKKNERDLREVPDEVKKDLQFEFVENVDELLKVSLDVEGLSQLPLPKVDPASTRQGSFHA